MWTRQPLDIAFQSVFGVSRQINAEASQVFWTKNTFSFGRADHFYLFISKLAKRGMDSLTHLRFRNVHMDRDHADWDSAINSLDWTTLQNVRSLQLNFQHEDSYEFRDKDNEIWVKPYVSSSGIPRGHAYKSRIDYNVQPFMDLRVLPFRHVTVTRQAPIGYFQNQTDVELSFCESLENHLLGLRNDWVLKRRHHGFIQREVQHHPFSRSPRVLELREQMMDQAFMQRLTSCDQWTK